MHYSRSLVYKHMTWCQQAMKTYEEALMKVARDTFCK